MSSQVRRCPELQTPIVIIDVVSRFHSEPLQWEFILTAWQRRNKGFSGGLAFFASLFFGPPGSFPKPPTYSSECVKPRKVCHASHFLGGGDIASGCGSQGGKIVAICCCREPCYSCRFLRSFLFAPPSMIRCVNWRDILISLKTSPSGALDSVSRHSRKRLRNSLRSVNACCE